MFNISAKTEVLPATHSPTFFALILPLDVFIPLIFIKGISGVLFRETAITLSFAIVVSSFVALTLSPMLGSKFLHKNTKKSKIVR